MIFNSVEFLIFLPIVFILYWLVSDKYKWIIILISSYYFYMSWNVKYVFLIFMTTFISYLCGLMVDRDIDKRKKKIYLICTLVICLGTLFIFKYFNFAVGSIAKIAGKFSIQLSPITLKLLLPVGISFYTFQTLSYVIDVYRGDIRAERHFGKYAAFISFFPQLVAGPIERAGNLLPQITEPKKFNYENAEYGIRMILLGFIKKVVIADNLAIFVNYIFNTSLKGGHSMILPVLGFTFQIYGDFSGYSDIAIGTAKLFNINLIQNFKSPYFATSVKEFWRRWHISLSNWFRDYLYIPLGGNRKGWLRSRINVMIVFLMSGLWHGADWHFVIWGGLHGFAQLFGGSNKKESGKVKKAICIFFTFIFISISWVFFRLGIGDSVFVIKNLFTKMPFMETINVVVESTLLTYTSLLIVAITVVLLMIFDYFSQKTDVLRKMDCIPWIARCFIYAIFIVFILFFMPIHGGQQFIYFQF